MSGGETPLAGLLMRRIAAAGPVTVAEFMETCLSHPEHGYYATRDPFGAAGDFVTAPEISQMFGEMLGLWLGAVWVDAGRPAPVRLVELGPGRGTLMADALRAIRLVPGMGDAVDLWLVETSPVLRAEQARRLPMASHAARLEEVPGGPALILANEFLDALPVHQFIASARGWHERQLGLVEGRLAWGLSAPLPGAAEEGAWAERSPLAEAVTGEVAARLTAEGGAALILDYGYRAASRPPGPTLQALSAHAHVDPLDRPGEADLTWLIDFDRLARDLTPLRCHHAEQGPFLGALGIGQRAAALAARHPARADALADALERLTAPDAMGRLFRVLAALPEGASPPPGFPPSP